MSDADLFDPELTVARPPVVQGVVMTPSSALLKMQEAYQELKAQGWADAEYCPKDGSTFLVIEAGSTGIHEATYLGSWPTGSIFVQSAGDLWPSRPILWKAIES